MSRPIAYLWGGVALTFIVLSPWAAALSAGLWPCAFKSLTGYACPTCGTTRAALLLARFDVLSALTLYPLATLGWIAFIGGGLGASLASLLGHTPPAIPTSLPRWARAFVITTLLLNWAYLVVTGA